MSDTARLAPKRASDKSMEGDLLSSFRKTATTRLISVSLFGPKSVDLSRRFVTRSGHFRPPVVEIDDHQHSMDPSSAQITPSVEEDEWDNDGFVIPSLTVGDLDQGAPDVSEAKDLKPPPPKAKKEEEKIYLGPHGAPPLGKQQELNAAGHRQRFRHKLNEADKKFYRPGRDNKLENPRELIGNKRLSASK